MVSRLWTYGHCRALKGIEQIFPRALRPKELTVFSMRALSVTAIAARTKRGNVSFTAYTAFIPHALCNFMAWLLCPCSEEMVH